MVGADCDRESMKQGFNEASCGQLFADTSRRSTVHCTPSLKSGRIVNGREPSIMCEKTVRVLLAISEYRLEHWMVCQASTQAAGFHVF